MSTWRKTLYAAASVVAVFGLLEIGARLVVPAQDVWLRAEHEQIIVVLGLSALNDTMEFDADLFWTLKPSLRDFRITGKILDNPIDFVVNTRDRLRVTPEPASRPAVGPTRSRPTRLLALGDSCTFGVGVDDDETWPAQLRGLLAATGREVQVLNAGVPGYTAFQGARLLERRGAELEPDVVVASFGFNDFDSWGEKSDLETFRGLRFRRWERPILHSRFYGGLRHLLRRDPPVDPEQPDGNVNEEGRSRLTPREFLEQIAAIKAWCDRNAARLVLVIWPYEGQIAQRFPDLVRYQQLTAHYCVQADVPCVNLVDAFLLAGRPMFLDHVHANVDGGGVAATAVLQAVEPLLAGTPEAR